LLSNLQIGLLKPKLLYFKLLLKVGGRSPLTFNLLFFVGVCTNVYVLAPKFSVFKGNKNYKNCLLFAFALLFMFA
jgi:hypothetical protein